MTRIASGFFASAILGCTAFGQIFSGISTSTNGGEATVMFRGNIRFIQAPVTGAPYSGEQVFEHTQTLSDGTHITQSNPGEKVYRDSQGRTRTERPLRMGPMGQGMSSPTIVQIVDPLAGVGYLLDAENKVAHRVVMERMQPRRVQAGMGGGGGTTQVGAGVAAAGTMQAGAIDSMRPQMTNEKLGTQMIEGVPAEGTRHTTTWPVGARGNDRPLTDSGETWMSTELHVVVLSKSSSLEFGDSLTKLTNISRAEPDPLLFQPPPDYTVVDDKGEVTIKFKRQP